MANALLIYDGDCAFCTRCVLWGQKHLTYFPPCIAYQGIEPARYGLSPQQVSASIWLVSADDQSKSNVPAMPANQAVAAILLGQSNLAWRFLGWAMNLPIARNAARALYYLVARNRHKMPGATDACQLPDSL